MKAGTNEQRDPRPIMSSSGACCVISPFRSPFSAESDPSSHDSDQVFGAERLWCFDCDGGDRIRQGFFAKELTTRGITGCLCDEGRRFRTTSKELDAETGLDYCGARYMSGAQRRFTNPDGEDWKDVVNDKVHFGRAGLGAALVISSIEEGYRRARISPRQQEKFWQGTPYAAPSFCPIIDIA